MSELPRRTTKRPVTVTVSGAAGNIGYALAFRLASGEAFGPDQPIVLQLLEIEPAMAALEGIVMELEDCAYPLLFDVVTTSNLKIAFEGSSFAFLVGSIPRRNGMERRDLLSVNGRIFKAQGRAIAAQAASDVRVLVIGNPCNTNCLIARTNAPEVPAERWFAMTRLDENRAKTLLGKRVGRTPGAVTRLAVWGNHSTTQFPDYENALIDGQSAERVIDDEEWLQGPFVRTIQERGATVIAARGGSSAGSAANAAIGSLRSIINPTPQGDWSSLAVVSHGEYGIPEGLQFGFPVRSDGNTWHVVEGLAHSAFAHRLIAATAAELGDERAEAADLLGGGAF
ncbi:MAG: malate dehydrogenase [Acidimicrobiales bacterium]|jgi:malate dehydrogenase